MKLLSRLSLFGLLGLLISVTGCASTNSNKQMNSLQAQINVLTDEVVRLDQELQNVRGSIQTNASASSASSKVAVGGPTYRTPSGFELPAMSIQQALKNAGYYQGNLDGKIGPSTQSSIQAFQRDHHLKVDGVVGRGTWAKLKLYLSGAVK